MTAVAFDAKILDGRIEIPKQYRNTFVSNIKVVLLKMDEATPELSYADLMKEAAQDDVFMSRTMKCQDDFRFVDSEVLGEW